MGRSTPKTVPLISTATKNTLFCRFLTDSKQGFMGFRTRTYEKDGTTNPSAVQPQTLAHHLPMTSVPPSLRLPHKTAAWVHDPHHDGGRRSEGCRWSQPSDGNRGHRGPDEDVGLTLAHRQLGSLVTWTAKRSLRRARARAAQHGQTMYKGAMHDTRSLNMGRYANTAPSSPKACTHEP